MTIIMAKFKKLATPDIKKEAEWLELSYTVKQSGIGALKKFCSFLWVKPTHNFPDILLMNTYNIEVETYIL